MDVIMPQLGETVAEGTVSNWYKKPGDAVTADEKLFEVETEKVTTEIPAPVSGVLAEILVEAGSTVKVGSRLAVIATPAAAQRADAGATSLGSSIPSAACSVASSSAVGLVGRLDRRGRARLSPLVRRLLREAGARPEHVPGTGKDGRITPADVRAHAQRAIEAQSAGTPSPPNATSAAARGTWSSGAGVRPRDGGDDFTAPLNRIRRMTAARVAESKAISPHALQAVEVDFHAVDAVRMRNAVEWRARDGFSLTYLPFVAVAACQALLAFPYVNASFVADALIVHKRVNLGIAVDINFEGLTVPVVRDADTLSLREMAAEIHVLADRARRAVLTPDQTAGGTYTISNNGSLGTYFSTPIINQPQVAILSLDAVRRRPVVIEDSADGSIAVRPVGVLAQSFDHRAFDGAYSAAFLRRLREVIESTDWSAAFN